MLLMMSIFMWLEVKAQSSNLIRNNLRIVIYDIIYTACYQLRKETMKKLRQA
jgi:hypothetical protein